MRLIATKDRNFNAIESSRFDLFQVRVVLFGHLGGPEQQIHANLHIVLGGSTQAMLRTTLSDFIA
jgi:hypothetical protein